MSTTQSKATIINGTTVPLGRAKQRTPPLLPGRRQPSSEAEHAPAVAPAAAPITVWGLTARELHDARWNAVGVQCLRQGDPVAKVDRTADLFLLLESDQCVLFDLSRLIDRLVWHGAHVTRIRIVEPTPTHYEERIVRDPDDPHVVQRIERRYLSAPQSHGESGTTRRALITQRPAIAERWLRASSPRQGWLNVRRVPGFRGRGRARIDRVRINGLSMRLCESRDDARLLTELVEQWTDLDRVLEGVEELIPGSGVWAHSRDRSRFKDGSRSAGLIGPVWLGSGHHPKSNHGCIVGPAWVRDDAGTLQAASHSEGWPPVTVRSFIDIDFQTRGRAKPRQGAGNQHSVPRVPITRAPSSLYPQAKRTMDVCVSAILLLAAAPLMLAIAIAVMIDDGRPVLFRHKRQTRGGRIFDCLKFRTMYRDAHIRVNELARMNICDGPQVYIHDDPRVTCVGRFLRKAHLDELPQLWNVLVGDMSLVGPRPSPDQENRYCPAWRELRLSVRPGITGLWQLRRTRRRGRDFQEWIRYDIEYVRSAGFWLDLRILLETARVLLFSRGREHESVRRTQE